jgi:hypothetical protein
VGVVGSEGKDRTEIELRQGPSLLLHTHSDRTFSPPMSNNFRFKGM